MRGGDWSITDHGGLRAATCVRLSAVPGIAHLFSTRGSVSGRSIDPAAIARSAGLVPEGLAAIRQVHGDRVLRLRGRSDDDDRVFEADGLVALRDDGRKRVPAVRTADCVPLLIAERGGRGVAAIHSGWRGTAVGIARRAVEDLRDAGLAPEGLVAAIGPSIGPCCYEVSHEVAARVVRATGVAAERLVRAGRRSRPRLDLARAVAAQLVEAGVMPDAISVAPWCTACREDLFFSYRRDAHGSGRMTSMIGWARAGNTRGPG